jgi:hypothetical protein
MNAKGVLPDPPSFSDEEMRHYRATGNYKVVLFEWYKFAGSLASIVAHIQPTSPAFSPIPAGHYHILMGLLNRCARLMLSNIALSHQGKFGETTAIIDRCIFESAIKLIWLGDNNSEEEFTRYLADGLRTEVDFKAYIETNIAANGGVALPAEQRMLSSIARHIAASRLTEADIISTKKLRDIASMLDGLGADRIFYITGQKIGSHHVHGTWSSLYMHYLQCDDLQQPFIFSPRGHDCDTYLFQYAFIPKVVLRAMRAYVRHMLADDEAKVLCTIFKSTEEEIVRLYAEAEPDGI